jgi:non-ribosomal peptide synthetase component F
MLGGLSDTVCRPTAAAVLVRLQIDPSASPRQLLKAEQAAMQGAISHSGVPFHEIVQALEVTRSPSYNPLIQATLTFDDDSESIID